VSIADKTASAKKAEASACRKSMFFQKKCLFSIPIPKPLSPGKGLYYWGYRPRPSKDACSQPHKATARCGGTNGWRHVRGLHPCDPIFI